MNGQEAECMVDVFHGIYAQRLPLAGFTVETARALLIGRMNVDPSAVSIVDGVLADGSTVLSAGQVLNFVKASGEMGSG